jgi:hypothetical protein
VQLEVQPFIALAPRLPQQPLSLEMYPSLFSPRHYKMLLLLGQKMEVLSRDFSLRRKVLLHKKTNLEAANGRIMDVDIAQESTALAKYNILVQASASMLSQANTTSNVALMLLN